MKGFNNYLRPEDHTGLGNVFELVWLGYILSFQFTVMSTESSTETETETEYAM